LEAVTGVLGGNSEDVGEYMW